MRLKWLFSVTLILVLAGAVVFVTADESGAEGTDIGYHLGRGGPMAGVVPPPGFYVRNDLYHYSGESKLLLTRPDVGSQDISVTSLINVFGVSWVPDIKVLGGRLGLGGGFAYGRKSFWADVTIKSTLFGVEVETLPQRVDGESTGLSDVGLAAVLGWHAGKSHFLTYTSVVAPLGEYDDDPEVYVNMGNNRWSCDVGTGYTYLNLDNGFEASGLIGFVFNGENEDTEYQPGIEFHAEAALVEHFSNRLSLGVAGYYYQQVTGNSGPDTEDLTLKIDEDILGRVAGAGPLVGYYFTFGERLFSINIRWYHEFSAQYRLEGDSIFGTIALSL